MLFLLTSNSNMIVLLLLFGLALGAVVPPEKQRVALQRGSCPSHWFSFNRRCYKYLAPRVTWADAELHCVSLGANLVSIHSLQEQDFAAFFSILQRGRLNWVSYHWQPFTTSQNVSQNKTTNSPADVT
uniref:C-type lectin domain-containing protein n=1 Tax=Stegastes partitus TaxID=144197 RepID=A0A3B4ZGY8_9TELE